MVHRYYIVDEDGAVTFTEDARVAMAAAKDESNLAVIDTTRNVDVTMGTDFSDGLNIHEQDTYRF